MSRFPIATSMSIAALGLGALAMPAIAAAQSQSGAPVIVQAVTERPSLNLSAYGEVKTTPDMATLNFGVMTEAPTAAEAMAQNAQRMQQVMASLARAGIEARYIQTSGLNLSPQYDYVENTGPRLRGYQANNRVTVIINDLDRVGSTADAVVAAGVNQIDGIAFGLKDTSVAENQARRLAVRALQAKAELYADATGIPLAGLRSLTEGGGYSPPMPMPMYARAEMAMDAAGTAVAPGELTVRIDITGIYDLAR